MAFTLPPLPYLPTHWNRTIDMQTMEIHHGKHHAAYVTNLNKALEITPDLQTKPLEELLANIWPIVPDGIIAAVRNNGGGHAHDHACSGIYFPPNRRRGSQGEIERPSRLPLATLTRSRKNSMPPPRRALVQAGLGW